MKQIAANFLYIALLSYGVSACKTVAPTAANRPANPALDERLADIPRLGPLRLHNPATYPLDYLAGNEYVGGSGVLKLSLMQAGQDWAEVEVCREACASYQINTLEAFIPLEPGAYQIKARPCFGFGATRSGQRECGAWGANVAFEQRDVIPGEIASLLNSINHANSSLQQEGEAAYQALAQFDERLGSCHDIDRVILAQASTLHTMTAAQLTAHLSREPFVAGDQLSLVGPAVTASSLNPPAGLTKGLVTRLQQAARFFQYWLTVQTLALVTGIFPEGVAVDTADLAAKASDKKALRKMGLDYQRKPTAELKELYVKRMQSIESRIVDSLHKGRELSLQEKAHLEHIKKHLPVVTGESRTVVEARINEHFLEDLRNQALRQLAIYEDRVKAGPDIANANHITKREAAAFEDLLQNVQARPADQQRFREAVKKGKENFAAWDLQQARVLQAEVGGPAAVLPPAANASDQPAALRRQASKASLPPHDPPARPARHDLLAAQAELRQPPLPALEEPKPLRPAATLLTPEAELVPAAKVAPVADAGATKEISGRTLLGWGVAAAAGAAVLGYVIGSNIPLAATCERNAASLLRQNVAAINQRATHWRTLRNGIITTLVTNKYLDE